MIRIHLVEQGIQHLSKFDYPRSGETILSNAILPLQLKITP